MVKLFSDSTTCILRFDRDDDAIQSLQDFCEQGNIDAGFFTGLGACQAVTIAYYDLASRQYNDKVLNESLEIVSLTGNIAQLDNNAVIHAHGVFSDSAYQTYGGHVKKLIVSATCELHLTVVKAKLKRAFDSTTGLNLLSDN